MRCRKVIYRLNCNAFLYFLYSRGKLLQNNDTTIDMIVSTVVLIMVEATGCGCPVDTSVQSTEAPTEAAAETSNLRHLPSCGSQSFVTPWSGAKTLTAAPYSPRLISHRERFGEYAQSKRLLYLLNKKSSNLLVTALYGRAGGDESEPLLKKLFSFLNGILFVPSL